MKRDPGPASQVVASGAVVPLALALAVMLSACSAATPAPAPASGVPRPSSPATIRIVEPVAGQAVSGDTVYVALELTGAVIVDTTSLDVRPDEGHVHLYVDSVLASMNYGLEQDLPVHLGTYVLRAEFVASDHAPFSPRVWSNEVVFTVR